MFSFLRLNNLPILEQLYLEEALLRADEGNWCLINTGSSDAIVVGISGKPDELVQLDRAKQKQIPIIRRYSGGGTVYVDPHTIFITFIGSGKKFPKALLEEGAHLLSPLFPPGFKLLENDYVIDDLKIGGNAQYLTASRWMHHISFLWDYDPQNMDLLHLPQKRPAYRQDRAHDTFLTTLKTFFPCKQTWIEQCQSHLLFALNAQATTLDLSTMITRPHRRGTVVLPLG